MRGAPARFARASAQSCSTIVNYSADAGAGSRIVTNLAESSGWRAALLGTVAAGALWLGAPRAAKAGPDACNVLIPGVATCQGNQSAGITSAGGTPDFNPATTTTLNVNTLTTNIAPGVGIDGIYFQRTGALNNIVINSDTNPFDIIVTGPTADGIDARSDAAITITHAGDIDASAGRHGISALVTLAGTGPLSITSYGSVTGAQHGIDARNYGTGPLSIVSYGAVTGSNTGIFARNDGTGALEIVANGDVVGTAANSYGIFARNFNVNSTDLSVTTEGVSGGTRGIQAFNSGTGALTIVANGDVEATGAFSTGIYARNLNAAGTGGITINAESASGTLLGIDARNFSTGALEITAYGDVAGTGANSTGIYARQSNAGTGPVSVTTEGMVTGSNRGIDALNLGTGTLEIVANGDVEGTNIGIFAQSSGVDGNGMSLSITSEGVTRGNYAISAINLGIGALEIVANGAVEGTGVNSRGINALNTAAGTGLSIASEGVSGGTYGIYARNYGSGALSIETNGDVEGTDIDGIYARNNNGVDADTGLSLSIVTEATVTGGTYGIRALNFGTGALEIVANGAVEGTGVNSMGISALQNNATGNLSITSEGMVTGGIVGIYARNFGTGALSIVANGDAAGGVDGIYAAGGGPIDITVGSGATVLGGSRAGVEMQYGSTNSLKNFGTIANLNGIGSTAILGGIGSETVNNFGVVTGNVLLDTGANEFNNMAGGLFNSGNTVNLDVGNLLTNHGTLSPGGAGTILTTELTGNFSQPGSELEVNLLGFQSDLLNVSGDTDLAGKVRPLFTLNGLGDARRWTVLNSGTDIVDNGIEPVSTLVVQFGLDFPVATQMDLVLDGVDFAVSGLNQNQTSIAKNLNKVFEAGNFPKLDQMMTALAFLPSEAAIARALDQLSPEIYLDTEIATLFAAQNFTSSLMTCPVREGPAAFIKEGQCVWARVSGRDLDQSKTVQTFGFDERSFEVAGGVQGALGEVWRLGFAGAYERSELKTTTNASSDSDRMHGGAVLKYNPGALLLAGAVSGGWGWYDTERPLNFPGFAALAQSEHDVGYVNGRLRAAYQLGAGNWYLKPMVDLDATHVRLDGVTEKGASGVGLKVRGADETVLSATPALELGAQFGNPNGTLVRPYVRGGATFYDDPDFVLLASFEGSPGSVGPFRIASSTDDVLANVGAGVDVIGAEGASFRLYYEARFGDLVEQHAGGIKGTLPF